MELDTPKHDKFASRNGGERQIIYKQDLSFQFLSHPISTLMIVLELKEYWQPGYLSSQKSQESGWRHPQPMVI